MSPPRGVHAVRSPSLMASMVRKPAATARSPQRLRADQNIVLHLARQKRCADPPRRARKGRPHHGHIGEVVMLTATADAPSRAAGRRAARCAAGRARPRRRARCRHKASARSLDRHRAGAPSSGSMRSTVAIAASTPPSSASSARYFVARQHLENSAKKSPERLCAQLEGIWRSPRSRSSSARPRSPLSGSTLFTGGFPVRSRYPLSCSSTCPTRRRSPSSIA
jgi:hypothetical protein